MATKTVTMGIPEGTPLEAMFKAQEIVKKAGMTVLPGPKQWTIDIVMPTDTTDAVLMTVGMYIGAAIVKEWVAEAV